MSSPVPSFPPMKAQKWSEDQSPSSLVTHALPPLPPRYPPSCPDSVPKETDQSQPSLLGHPRPSSSEVHELGTYACPPSISNFRGNHPNVERPQPGPSQYRTADFSSAQASYSTPMDIQPHQLSRSKQRNGCTSDEATLAPTHQSPSFNQSCISRIDQIASSTAPFPVGTGLISNDLAQDGTLDHNGRFSSASASGNHMEPSVRDSQKSIEIQTNLEAGFDQGLKEHPADPKSLFKSISNKTPQTDPGSHPQGDHQEPPCTGQESRDGTPPKQVLEPPSVKYSSTNPPPHNALTGSSPTTAAVTPPARNGTEPSISARDPLENERSTTPNRNAPLCPNPLEAVCDPLSLHFHSNQPSNSVPTIPEGNGFHSYCAPAPPSYIGLPQNINVIQPASVPKSPDPNAVNPWPELTQASLQPLATNLDFHGYANGFGFEAAAGISSGVEAGVVAGHVQDSAFDPFSCYHSETLARIHSRCDVGSPTGDADAQCVTQAVQMAPEDLGQMQQVPPEFHDYLSLLTQGMEESPQPDPEYWDWQSSVQMAQEKVESNPHLQAFSSLVASFSPASSNPMYVDGMLYNFGCHHPGEILTSFGFPKDDRDAEYCVENTPGLSKDNFGVLEKTVLWQVRVIRMAAAQAAAELENIFIAHMAYRVITECEVYVRFEHLVNTFLESRQCIIERYRCYVRNLRAIENVSTRQRRGCLEHRQNNTMRRWLYEHFGNPYPEGNDKKRLMEETGLKGRQINNWFINARSRIWRPTVEGMSREFLQQAADMLYEDRYSKVKRKPKIELEGGGGELSHVTGEGAVRN